MIVQDAGSGEIVDEGIRYLMIRADVLMGLAREWPQGDSRQFVQALERAVFRHSRDSFAAYQSSGRFGEGDFLSSVAQVASQLGWGSWRVIETRGDHTQIAVRNSPFAAGFGRASHPVCGAICGVLRAIVLVGYGRESQVTETVCTAQSHGAECVFNLTLG